MEHQEAMVFLVSKNIILILGKMDIMELMVEMGQMELMLEVQIIHIYIHIIDNKYNDVLLQKKTPILIIFLIYSLI